jgi:hypothetical protein
VAALRRILSTQGLDLHDLSKVLLSPQPQARSWRPDPPPRDEEPWDNRQGNQYRRWGGRQNFEHYADVKWCLDNNKGRLSEREIEFLESLFDWEEPTEPQMEWLLRIRRKLERKDRQSGEYWDWGE